MPIDHYPGDPHWVTVKKYARCAGCDETICPGEFAYEFKGGALYGGECGCGKAAEDKFLAEAEDEWQYNHPGGGDMYPIEYDADEWEQYYEWY